MRADPTCQLLVGSGLSVGVGAGSKYSDEQMRLLRGTTARIVDRDRGSRAYCIVLTFRRGLRFTTVGVPGSGTRCR
jgi:hypothetical protein